MQEIQDDFYNILGVDEQTATDDIRKAYLKLAKKLHPDRHNDPEKKAAAQADFARVTRAYEVLGDAKQRDEYDAIRILARNRAALATGSGGGTDGVISKHSSAPNAEHQRESKETWAARHSQRAEDSFRMKRFQDAEMATKEAIRLCPEKAKFHAQLAKIYVARGWKTLALTEIQAALRIDPDDEDAKLMDSKLKLSQKVAGSGEKKNGGFLDSLNKLLGKK